MLDPVHYLEIFKDDYIIGLTDFEDVVLFEKDTGLLLQCIQIRLPYPTLEMRPVLQIIHLPFNCLLLNMNQTKLYFIKE